MKGRHAGLLVMGASGWGMAVWAVAKFHARQRWRAVPPLVLRPWWWAVVFQIAVYVSLGLALEAGLARHCRIALVTFLALASVNTERLAELMLQMRPGGRSSWAAEGDDASAARVGAAGFILCTLVNFLFIMALGSGEWREGWDVGSSASGSSRLGASGPLASPGRRAPVLVADPDGTFAISMDTS